MHPCSKQRLYPQNPIRPGGTHASALLSSFRYSSLTTRLCNTPLTWIGEQHIIIYN